MMSRKYLEGKLKRKKQFQGDQQEQEVIFCIPQDGKRKADNIWIQNEEGMLQFYNKSKQVKIDIEELCEQTNFLATNKQPIITLQKLKESDELLTAKREFFHLELQKQFRQKTINDRRSYNYIKLKIENGNLVQDNTEQVMEVEGNVDFYRMGKQYKEDLDQTQYEKLQIDSKELDRIFNSSPYDQNDYDSLEDKFSDQSEQSDIDYPDEESSDHSDKEYESDDYGDQVYHQPDKFKQIEYENDDLEIVDDTNRLYNRFQEERNKGMHKQQIRDFDYNKDF